MVSGNIQLEVFNRGFTGHEHFFDVALIHMNGRMYDAQLGRFLSPDNNIQDPFNTQSFNRYGYVWNNPLSFNDPDGEFIIPALIGAAIGVITNGINNSIHGRGFFKGAGTAALIGAIGGAASFGIGEMALGIGQGLTSSGQWLAQTSFQMGAHAILGGYINVFQGGEFGAGALSGAFGSVFGGATNSLLKNAGGFLRATGTTFSGAMSGGFGSVMAGGNFWEGARNGAISAGLNHAAHIILQTKPNWNKLTDDEKIEQILNSLPNGSENKSGHLDMHKIFKNFPTKLRSYYVNINL